MLCHLLRIGSREELILNAGKGAVIETLAVSEMLKNRLNRGKKADLTFFRDKKGFEVDTIADWKHTFAIEVKSSGGAEGKLSANIRKYLEARGEADARGAVFYLGDVSAPINDIDYVGWKDWGEYLDSRQ